jgi:paraquat-inducible protein A
MKLENEDALDRLIICPHCHTLHEEIHIADGTKACCVKCGNVLYRYDSRLIDQGLALSLTALIFFAVANIFPVVQIEILGNEQFITIPRTFLSLIENGFYFVGLFCGVVLFLFPLAIFTLYVLLFLLLKFQRGEELSRNLLVGLSYMKPWSMNDIFLISILVALVKLIGYAQIHMGMAFWALVVFVLLDVYMTRYVKLNEIWILRKQIFMEKQ